MAHKVRLRRGLSANLPTLTEGEAGFCTDTGDFYVGNGSGNTLINPVKKEDMTELRKMLEEHLEFALPSLYIDLATGALMEEHSRGIVMAIDSAGYLTSDVVI